MKRFELLVKAMQHVKSGVRAVIAGDGPERDDLAELIGKLGVGDRVELLGWVDDDRAVELYAGALAVYYAPYDEDYGYVTVEAYQAGKPVVTLADAGGVLELVRDGENGFVCPPGAPAEVARRLDRLYEHREEARRMGEAGARSVGDIHWDAVVGRLLGTAEEAACAASPTSPRSPRSPRGSPTTARSCCRTWRVTSRSRSSPSPARGRRARSSTHSRRSTRSPTCRRAPRVSTPSSTSSATTATSTPAPTARSPRRPASSSSTSWCSTTWCAS